MATISRSYRWSATIIRNKNILITNQLQCTMEGECCSVRRWCKYLRHGFPGCSVRAGCSAKIAPEHSSERFQLLHNIDRMHRARSDSCANHFALCTAAEWVGTKPPACARTFSRGRDGTRKISIYLHCKYRTIIKDNISRGITTHFWKSVNKLTAKVNFLSKRWLFKLLTASSAFSGLLYSRKQ